MEILRYTVSLKHSGAWATFGSRDHAEEWLEAHPDYSGATIEDQQNEIVERNELEARYRKLVTALKALME